MQHRYRFSDEGLLPCRLRNEVHLDTQTKYPRPIIILSRHESQQS